MYKSLIGVGVSNCKKADLIAAISPKLENRKLLGNTSLIEEEVPQEEQTESIDNENDEDSD